MLRKHVAWWLPIALVAIAATGCGDDNDNGSGSGSDNSSGDDFPTSNLTVIVPYAPGGSIDTLARAVAPVLEEASGVGVEVVNREGGAGAIGTTEMIQAQPDGYTLGLTTTSIIGLGPAFQDGLAFESPDTYDLVLKVGPQPHILYVAGDSPLRNIEDFVEAARAAPGELRVGNSGANSSTHVTMADLGAAAGIEVTDVPLSGSEALVEVLGGRVDAAVGSSGTVIGDVEAGTVRVIGTFTDGEHAVFPDAQTVAEAGYPGTGVASAPYFVVPSGVDEPTLTALRDIFQEVIADTELKAQIESFGFELDPQTTSESLRQEINDLRDRLREIGLTE